MKRELLYILTAAALLAGCQKEETPSNAELGTLEFNTSIDEMSSRATSRAIADANFDAFGIFIAGYHTSGKIAAAIAADPSVVVPNVFNRDAGDGQLPVPHVTKGAVTGKYTLATVKWTLDQTTCLSYFSWTQGKAMNTTSGVVAATKEATDAGYPWLDVVNDNDINAQIDIAAANYLDQTNDRVVSAIDLNFKHILSKLTFKFRSSTGASVSIAKADLSYGTGMVQSKGRYTFNSDADKIGAFGTLTTPHTGTYTLGATHTITNGAETTAGSMLLIPQSVAKGFLRLELTYSITNGISPITATKSIDLPATALTGGMNHIYTVDLTPEEVVVYEAQIGDWITESTSRLPLVGGPRGDVQLLLDGYDAPYTHTDGKVYWLDRSGYNRHVELTGGFVTYDVTLKAYRFKAGDNGGTVPALGAMSELTMDVVATTTSGASNVPLILNSSTGARAWFNMNYKNLNQLHLNRGDGLGVNTVMHSTITDADYFKKVRLYTLQWSDTKWLSYDNASIVLDTPYLGTDKLVSFDGGFLSNNNFAGDINYVKVTSKVTQAGELVSNFKKIQKKFNIEKEFLLPVTDGLVGWYDGYIEPQYVGGKKVWVDKSPTKNDAELFGTVFWDSDMPGYNTTSGRLELVGKDASYLYDATNGMTVQLLFRRNSIWTDYVVFRIGDGSTTHGLTEMISWKPAGAKYMVWKDSGSESITWGESTELQDVNNIGSWTFAKAGHNTTNNHRGYRFGTEVGVAGSNKRVSLSGKSIIQIPGPLGVVVALRLYNRQLTSEEVKQNNDFDKAYYNLQFD